MYCSNALHTICKVTKRRIIQSKRAFFKHFLRATCSWQILFVSLSVPVCVCGCVCVCWALWFSLFISIYFVFRRFFYTHTITTKTHFVISLNVSVCACVLQPLAQEYLAVHLSDMHNIHFRVQNQSIRHTYIHGQILCDCLSFTHSKMDSVRSN